MYISCSSSQTCSRYNYHHHRYYYCIRFLTHWFHSISLYLWFLYFPCCCCIIYCDNFGLAHRWQLWVQSVRYNAISTHIPFLISFSYNLATCTWTPWHGVLTLYNTVLYKYALSTITLDRGLFVESFIKNFRRIRILQMDSNHRHHKYKKKKGCTRKGCQIFDKVLSHSSVSLESLQLAINTDISQTS